MGTPGPHIPGFMGTRAPKSPRICGPRLPISPFKMAPTVPPIPEQKRPRDPISPRIWAPGVPILGGPNFHMTPVQLHGRLGADSWEASGVLDPDRKYTSGLERLHTCTHTCTSLMERTKNGISFGAFSLRSQGRRASRV